MTEVNTLLQKLDDALDKVVHQKEPESFLKPIVSEKRASGKSKRNSQTCRNSMKRKITPTF
ncbi:hypothetical protein JP0018_09550 [Helicobacter pylori]